MKSFAITLITVLVYLTVGFVSTFKGPVLFGLVVGAIIMSFSTTSAHAGTTVVSINLDINQIIAIVMFIAASAAVVWLIRDNKKGNN